MYKLFTVISKQFIDYNRQGKLLIVTINTTGFVLHVPILKCKNDCFDKDTVYFSCGTAYSESRTSQNDISGVSWIKKLYDSNIDDMIQITKEEFFNSNLHTCCPMCTTLLTHDYMWQQQS